MQPNAKRAPVANHSGLLAETRIDVHVSIRQPIRRLPRAAVVGLAAGLAALAFRAALAAATGARLALVGRGHRWPAGGWIVPAAIGALIAGLSVFLVRCLGAGRRRVPTAHPRLEPACALPP